MTTQEIGNRLVEMCSQGKNVDFITQFYAEDVVSEEAFAPPNVPSRETKGIAAVRAKSEWWRANNEVHSMKVEGPWPHDDKFIVRFSMDITQKQSGKRFQMEEAALYWVKNDKIVREEFFYKGM